jgi:L-fucose isomerase-like protein
MVMKMKEAQVVALDPYHIVVKIENKIYDPTQVPMFVDDAKVYWTKTERGTRPPKGSRLLFTTKVPENNAEWARKALSEWHRYDITRLKRKAGR